MPEELSNDSEFWIFLPIWFLANPKAAEAIPSTRGVLQGSNKRLGKFPLLFADPEGEGADEYRDSRSDLAGYVKVALKTTVETLEFLDVAEKGGCKYVAFDVYKRRARFMSIAKFREQINSKQDSL